MWRITAGSWFSSRPKAYTYRGSAALCYTQIISPFIPTFCPSTVNRDALAGAENGRNTGVEYFRRAFRRSNGRAHTCSFESRLDRVWLFSRVYFRRRRLVRHSPDKALHRARHCRRFVDGGDNSIFSRGDLPGDSSRQPVRRFPDRHDGSGLAHNRTFPSLGVGLAGYNKAAQTVTPSTWAVLHPDFREALRKGIVHNKYLLTLAETGRRLLLLLLFLGMNALVPFG